LFVNMHETLDYVITFQMLKTIMYVYMR